MPATPSRIGFVMQPVRIVTTFTPDAHARHGSLARHNEEPVETFFDSEDDAQLVSDQRQILLSLERRRFSVTTKGLGEILDEPVAGPGLPQAMYVDPDRGIARDVLVAEVGFDFAGQKANLVVWG